jgi:hypothetical protein
MTEEAKRIRTIEATLRGFMIVLLVEMLMLDSEVPVLLLRSRGKVNAGREF